jgi:hypothetical protein
VSREENGRGAKNVEELREETKSGGLVQGRKDAACRQGCQFAGSLVGRRLALVTSSGSRVTHVACDSIIPSKMCVGAMRI